MISCSMNVRCPKLAFLHKSSLPFHFPKRVLLPRFVFSCGAKSPVTEIAAQKEEAKAVLTSFLKERGLSKVVVERVINKSEAFIDHLASRLEEIGSVELTTSEIKDVLIPYLETLHQEHGDILLDVVESYNDPIVKEEREVDIQEPPLPSSLTSTNNLNPKKLRALARFNDIGPRKTLPSYVPYLAEFGIDLEMIKKIACRYPPFAFSSLEGKIKPLVEFLLELGVPKSNIATILVKCPQLCTMSLSRNLIPKMMFLEDLGVDKKKWPRLLHRSPMVLTCSKPKLKMNVDFLYEIGLSAEDVSRAINRCPSIMCLSIEDKLKPTLEYFRGLGVDAVHLLSRSPLTFTLNLEGNIKPKTDFFLDRGFSVAGVAAMVSRYGCLHHFSLANLTLKLDFFMSTDYPTSELIKNPQYFGASLEDKIKPRYATMLNYGVRLPFSLLLCLDDHKFVHTLEVKLKKIKKLR